MTLGGWAQYARYKLWQAELAGGSDETITDFLAIRLIWEEALFLRYERQIAERWASVRDGHAAPVEATPDLVDRRRSFRRRPSAPRSGRLAATLAAPSPHARSRIARRCRPRSASTCARRCSAARSKASIPRIQTLGLRRLFRPDRPRTGGSPPTSRNCGCRCCSIPRSRSCSGGPDDARRRIRPRGSRRARSAPGAGSSSPPSRHSPSSRRPARSMSASCSTDALGLHGARPPSDPAPRLDPALDRGARTKAAETVLRAMSLTARLRAAGAACGSRRQRRQQSARQRAALRRLRRLFGRGQRAPAGGAPERSRRSGRDSRSGASTFPTTRCSWRRCTTRRRTR